VSENPVDLLLGVDIGTSSAKGVVARADGRIVAQAQTPHSASLPRPGWVEHDAETAWWGDFLTIAHELTAQSAGLGRIVGVGISGIGPSLLPVDAEGRALRPAILILL